MSAKNNTQDSNGAEALEMTVGTKLSFDKSEFDHAVSTIERAIIPAMRDVVSAYRELNAGPFDTEIWTQVIGNNLTKAKSAYTALVTKQASKLGGAISAMVMDQKVIDGSFAPFRKAVEKLHTAFSMTQQVPINAPKITLSDCLVNDEEEPVVDKTALEARFTVSVSNEAQIALLKLLTDLKERYDVVRGFLRSRPGWERFSILTDRPGLESLVTEDEDGSLVIDHKIVSMLNS